MNVYRLGAVSALGALAAFSSLGQSPKALADLMERSPYGFVGTVMKIRASNMPNVAAEEDTLIVRIDHVVHTPPSFGSLQGKEMTLRVAKPFPQKAGQQFTFFVQPSSYGTTIYAVEVGRLPAPQKLATLDEQVRSARVVVADRALSARTKHADVIVQGQVLRVESAESRDVISEHAPHWQRAVIQVEGVLKGSHASPTIDIFFPASQDELWSEVPKFQPGQAGIWMVGKQELFAARHPAPGPTALDAQDFQPKSQIDRVKRLAAASAR
jgi:hypothetical protein